MCKGKCGKNKYIYYLSGYTYIAWIFSIAMYIITFQFGECLSINSLCFNWCFTIYMYTEPKWKLYTFIIQIANTILNQCISLCLYKIGHISFYPIKLSRYRRVCSTCMRKHISLAWYSLVWWLPILCCFSCTVHNEQPSKQHQLSWHTRFNCWIKALHNNHVFT